MNYNLENSSNSVPIEKDPPDSQIAVSSPDSYATRVKRTLADIYQKGKKRWGPTIARVALAFGTATSGYAANEFLTPRYDAHALTSPSGALQRLENQSVPSWESYFVNLKSQPNPNLVPSELRVQPDGTITSIFKNAIYQSIPESNGVYSKHSPLPKPKLSTVQNFYMEGQTLIIGGSLNTGSARGAFEFSYDGGQTSKVVPLSQFNTSGNILAFEAINPTTILATSTGANLTGNNACAFLLKINPSSKTEEIIPVKIDRGLRSIAIVKPASQQQSEQVEISIYGVSSFDLYEYKINPNTGEVYEGKLIPVQVGDFNVSDKYDVNGVVEGLVLAAGDDGVSYYDLKASKENRFPTDKWKDQLGVRYVYIQDAKILSPNELVVVGSAVKDPESPGGITVSYGLQGKLNLTTGEYQTTFLNTTKYSHLESVDPLIINNQQLFANAARNEGVRVIDTQGSSIIANAGLESPPPAQKPRQVFIPQAFDSRSIDSNGK